MKQGTSIRHDIEKSYQLREQNKKKLQRKNRSSISLKLGDKEALQTFQ